MTFKSACITTSKYIALLAVAGYLAFAVVRLVRPARDAVCQGVELSFDGDSAGSLISKEDIMDILRKRGIQTEGQAFSSIDMPLIDSLLSANPYIDSVVVYPNSAGELCIRLSAACPVLHVFPLEGKEFYLDRSGKTMPGASYRSQSPNLCVVTGNVTQQWAKSCLLSLGKTVCDDPYWRLQAQQINVTEKREIQLIPRTGNHIVILGDTSDIEDKLRRVRLFYEKAMPEAGWNTYATINAEYRGQLVCTRRRR
ncbi:MAG: hypothetical protein LUC33_01780 [Prevotellaceae bacterium]|nr:hypothetical protein [Prevotellaceae bacterium]